MDIFLSGLSVYLILIYINSKHVDINSIPKDKITHDRIELDSKEFVDIDIIERNEKERNLRWSGIAWIVNGRRVGDSSWEGLNTRFIDGRTELSRRYLICVHADILSDIVNEDWTSFDTTSNKYKDVAKNLFSYIRKFVDRINSRDATKKIKNIRQRTGLFTEKLPPSLKVKMNSFIDTAVVQCPSIQESDFEHLVKILATLESSQNKYAILSKLASLSNDDWDKLDAIIDEWTIAVAKEVLDEIQHRLNLINELRRVTSNVSSYEVQELQPIMEKCLWIFGPEYESIEYTSNQAIATCFQKYMGKKASIPTTKNRPDFTIIPDGAVSFYSTPAYDDGHEDGIERLIIVELKAPGVKIGRDEKSQPMKYYDEFRALGMVTEQSRATAFVLGAQKDAKLPIKPFVEGPIEVRVMLFSTLLSRAESRLLRLRDRLNLDSRAPFLQQQLSS